MGRNLLLGIMLLFFSGVSYAQEIVAPLHYNPVVQNARLKPKLKTTVLSLPFFEDFTDKDPLPDNSRWTDRSVYINNTMAVSPISRGVATLDALNAQGAPYDSFNVLHLRYADSLTSQPIDLSTHVPADSIYLSFFYQPQGVGFAPETQDSLMLYFKDANSVWIKVWSKEGTTIDSFRQVMIAVKDADYFHGSFQFRFVNKESKYLTDDVWNVDYIRMAANRNIYDTTVGDITTTNQPANILNDYTAMPYRHFKANMNGELAANHSFSVKNLYGSQQAVMYGYTAKEQASNTPIFSSNVSSDNLPPYVRRQYQFPVYTSNYNAPSAYSRVVFENKYFVSDPSVADPEPNDTIIHEQIFDNYLAYDDGTAEMSYFLLPFITLPAKMAIEFHLNQPDTLRGLAIYFGRQVPLPFSKYFSIAVYKNITLGAWQDTPIYQQDLNLPGYVDTVNHFWVYSFDAPVPLGAGTFFIGTTQPAQSGSDSLYFGLDMNRMGGNHLYVNINGYWASSSIKGAVMMRPLLGQPVFTTDIKTPGKATNLDWTVYPNPAENRITIDVPEVNRFVYEIIDMQGRVLLQQEAHAARSIDISTLSSGVYFVRIFAEGRKGYPQKIIKL